MYISSINFHGMFIVVSTLQNLLYCSLYQLTIYLHNLRSERFGMLSHSTNFAFLTACTLPSVFIFFDTLKAMTTENEIGKISRNPHFTQTKLYDIRSIYKSKNCAVLHCIRHRPRDGMSGISPVNSLKINF